MSGSVEYAWARIGAAQSRRPGPSDWRCIESVRSLPALLEAARGTPLAAWLAGVDVAAGPHAIETALRIRWRARVAEVARWMPAAWQPSVRWWAWLPDLPPLAALARGETLPRGWTDDAYREVARAAPPDDSPWAPLRPAWDGTHDVAQAWRDEWLRRLPPRPDPIVLALELAARSHLEAFRRAAPGSGSPLRAALAARLRVIYRRATASPGAIFVFLAQTLLDVERLRGELLRRCALPRVPLAP
jgi:hypothetical protein